jgi:hypothetical protein
MSAQPRRLGLYVPWALFAVVCLGWIAFWFVAKDAAIRRLDAAITRAGARGIEAGYETIHAGGFPLHLTLTLEGAHVQASPLPRLTFKRLPISVNLVDPMHVIVDLKDGVRWTGRDGAAHVIDPLRGAMSVRLAKGKVQRISLDLEGAPAPHLLVHLRPDTRAADTWQVAVDIASSETNSADRLRMGVVIDHGAAFAALRPGDPLGAWTDAGGAAIIEVIDMDWRGSKVTGTGRLTLDSQRRPQGAVDLRIEGPVDDLVAMLGAHSSADAQGAVQLVARDSMWRLGEASMPARPLYALSSPPSPEP